MTQTAPVPIPSPPAPSRLSVVLAVIVALGIGAGMVGLEVTGHPEYVVPLLASAPPTIGAVLAWRQGVSNGKQLAIHGAAVQDVADQIGPLTDHIRAGLADGVLSKAIVDALAAFHALGHALPVFITGTPLPSGPTMPPPPAAPAPGAPVVAP